MPSEVSVFDYVSYKKFLKDLSAKINRTGLISHWAQSAGCNRSYFSQMLNSKVQLTPDHAVKLGRELDLDELEQDFFLNLVLFERAGDPDSQAHFTTQLGRIREAHSTLSKRVRQKSQSDELQIERDKNLYYSDWRFVALHILSSSADLNSTEELADYLGVRSKVAAKILNKLKTMGLVKKRDGGWQHSGASLHIDKDSNHTTQNHMNWRIRAVEESRKKAAVNYTGVFTVSKSDVPKLRAQLLRFIDEQRELIGASGTDELVCFNCDLFSPRGD